MSNCINFYRSTNRVTFTERDIDLQKVADLVFNRAAQDNIDKIPKEDKDAQCAWWYMLMNSQILNDPKGLDTFMIDIGDGKSTHTWRDFRWLLSVLKPLMLRSKVHNFLVSDEYDGHSRRFSVKLDFASPLNDKNEINYVK